MSEEIGYTCKRCNKVIEEDNGCECVTKRLMPLYEEEWSLKGKGLYDYPDIDNTIEYYNIRLKEERDHELRCGCDVQSFYKEYKTEDDVKIYWKNDIEILKEKLIEDLWKLMKEDMERIGLSISPSFLKDMPEVRMTAKEAIMKCEKIINKRFGKDE